MEKTRYYKVSIKIKDRSISNMLNLSELEEDIVQARMEFNIQSQIQLALFRIHPKRINIIVRTDLEFKCCLINSFFSILIGEMQWSVYSFKDSKDFDFVFSKEISRDECFNYLNDNNFYDKNILIKWASLDGYNLKQMEGVDSQGFPRRRHESRIQDNREKIFNIDKLTKKVDKLIGQAELKKELLAWIHIKEKLQGKEAESLEIPYKYIFIASPGSGITTAVKTMAEIFYGLGITPHYEFTERVVGEKERRPFFMHRENAGILKAYHLKNKNNIEELLDGEDIEEESPTIFIVNPEDKESSAIINKLDLLFNCKKININQYTNQELLEFLEARLETFGFQLDSKSKVNFKEYIADKKDIKTTSHIFGRIIKDQIGNLGADDKLEIMLENLDFNSLFPSEKEADDGEEKVKALEELNSLIGLDNVKTQVKDIINQIIVSSKRIEKGLDNEKTSPTMHMNFYGNPGTGKTTVARLIGKVLKEEGILKKGEFYEVGREDLVAAYVGHTALRTKSILDKALGSVLFIDEAYSLDRDSNGDFGKEAIDTIVRHMENNRDNMVIIFAGYKKEMENMFGLNPGLKSRVPFQVEFSDYDENDLISIFDLMIKDKYSYKKDVKEELLKFFRKAIKYYEPNFANGRFVRNMLERLVIKQSSRLVSQESYREEDLKEIKLIDLLNVLNEGEYKEINEAVIEKRKMGFSKN